MKTSKRKTFDRWGGYFSGYLLPAVLVVGLFVGAVWMARIWFEGTPPEIQLRPEDSMVGASQEFTLAVADAGSGLSRIKVRFRQGSTEKEVVFQSFPGRRWGRGGDERKVELPLILEPKAWGCQDGPAELIIQARDYSWRGWFKGNTASLTRKLTIDLTPLRLTFISINEFINQGGTGLVVYQINKPAAASGVRVNGELFPGFPAPGGDAGRRLAFFAVPYLLPQPLTLELIAADQGGAEVKNRVHYRLKSKRWRADRINLSDAFLNRKMPEFQEVDQELKNIQNPLEVFLRINRDEREKNNRLIQEICKQSQPERLWQGAFVRLPNSKPMAAFADHRSYIYQGREIDRQVHLGQDLASLEKALIPAANHGLVIFTGPLGIYGQSVVLDHGWGLCSLYSHLSEIRVEKGQRVNKGEVLGRTGATGMAGGDHLHFSVMIQGKFVNPLEWWDLHWIKDQVERQLAGIEPAVAATAQTAPPKAARTKPRTAKKRNR